MKRILILLSLSLVFISCETEDANRVDANATDLNTTFTFNSLINSPIGYEKDGKVQLGVTNEKIMETFRQFTRLHKSELNPQSFEVITIDNNHYLRFYSDNAFVSTIALNKDENNQYLTGTTICESRQCATSGGCIPDGEYCTKCRPETSLPGGPDGDCARTTISNIPPDA